MLLFMDIKGNLSQFVSSFPDPTSLFIMRHGGLAFLDLILTLLVTIYSEFKGWHRLPMQLQHSFPLWKRSTIPDQGVGVKSQPHKTKRQRSKKPKGKSDMPPTIKELAMNHIKQNRVAVRFLRYPQASQFFNVILCILDCNL